jgi:hypothetical protein
MCKSYFWELLRPLLCDGAFDSYATPCCEQSASSSLLHALSVHRAAIFSTVNVETDVMIAYHERLRCMGAEFSVLIWQQLTSSEIDSSQISREWPE